MREELEAGEGMRGGGGVNRRGTRSPGARGALEENEI